MLKVSHGLEMAAKEAVRFLNAGAGDAKVVPRSLDSRLKT
jgi:hypothetical protein